MNPLDSIEIDTQESPDAAIVWLHGLGADGNDFAPIVPDLGVDDLAIRFIFPHAPIRPITINGGYQMPGWYDIASSDIVGREDEDGIRETSNRIQEIVDRLNDEGIPSERIIMAGFSQGGAIALHHGLRQSSRLAGIMALSTYLPLRDKLQAEAHAANTSTDIFMAHGNVDDVVLTEYGKRSFQILREAGYPIHWREYPMGHSVCEQEITDIGGWIRDRLS